MVREGRRCKTRYSLHHQFCTSWTDNQDKEWSKLLSSQFHANTHTMSSNVPTMTTLNYVFYSPLESHRLTHFGVFSVHHLQMHLIAVTSVVFPVHFQHYVRLVLQNGLKDVKLTHLCHNIALNTFTLKFSVKTLITENLSVKVFSAILWQRCASFTSFKPFWRTRHT
jgi:hypothetical protein